MSFANIFSLVDISTRFVFTVLNLLQGENNIYRVKNTDFLDLGYE